MEAEHNGNAVARRCSTCGISWPIAFEKCYSCGGKTDPFRGSGPSITEAEAQSMKNHFLFEEYLTRTERD